MKFMSKRIAGTAVQQPEELLSTLPERFRAALRSMYAGEHQIGSNGGLYALDLNTRISPAEGMWLYEMCRTLRPKQTLEIGLAYGFSTIYFLAAIHDNGSGFHIAIDPFQHHPDRPWRGIGVNQCEKLAMTHAFRFIDERSAPALADLARGKQRFELIFVDGNHRFDNVLVDFTLSAELCPLGGYIVLDDLWMPSIQRAVSFVRKNRDDFREVATLIPRIAAFERVGLDERQWDHHVNF